MGNYRIQPDNIPDINTREKERKEALKKLRNIAYRAEKYGWTKIDIRIALEDYIKFEVKKENQ